MSGTKNTGGPAFPMQEPQAIHAVALAKVRDIVGTDERDQAYLAARAEAVGGMTLRDYFAANAMQAQIARFPDGHPKGWPGIAQGCYAMADAMLAAREAS